MCGSEKQRSLSAPRTLCMLDALRTEITDSRVRIRDVTVLLIELPNRAPHFIIGVGPGRDGALHLVEIAIEQPLQSFKIAWITNVHGVRDGANRLARLCAARREIPRHGVVDGRRRREAIHRGTELAREHPGDEIAEVA